MSDTKQGKLWLMDPEDQPKLVRKVPRRSRPTLEQVETVLKNQQHGIVACACRAKLTPQVVQKILDVERGFEFSKVLQRLIDRAKERNGGTDQTT